MKKMKRMMGIFAALAVLALGGCSDAGETSAEIEEIRGPESAASSETALTGDDAVSRAEAFIEGIAPGVFGVSLRNPEPEEIDGTAVYVMNLQVDGNLDADGGGRHGGAKARGRCRGPLSERGLVSAVRMRDLPRDGGERLHAQHGRRARRLAALHRRA